MIPLAIVAYVAHMYVHSDRPSLAIAPPNGMIAATADWHHRVVVIDRSSRRIVWQYGHYDAPRNRAGPTQQARRVGPPARLDRRLRVQRREQACGVAMRRSLDDCLGGRSAPRS